MMLSFKAVEIIASAFRRRSAWSDRQAQRYLGPRNFEVSSGDRHMIPGISVNDIPVTVFPGDCLIS
ncbi:hypothetical protein ACR0WH_003018, partial [Enterobacter hormaechei]